MRRFFVFLLGLVLFASTLSMTRAQESVQKLLDERLQYASCTLSGVLSCEDVDGEAGARLQKTRRVERFVPGSGYLAVFLRDNTASFSASGGLDLNDIQFVSQSGEDFLIGQGLQVFERGNIVLEFEQPVFQNQRLEVDSEIVVYYLPHSMQDRRRFLAILQDDPSDFEQYKRQQRREIDSLCDLITDENLPEGCDAPQTVVDSSAGSPVYTGNQFETDPNTLPELDFSGDARRAPELTIYETERQAFVGEPVTLEIDQVYDPDGKCSLFQFTWQKPESLQVREVDVDPYLGDLFFIPQNTGAFTLRVSAQEACGSELGQLRSSAVRVRLLVNDKATAFPDLQGNQYANALYDLYHLGVLRGYPDGTMRPDAAVNRAEFLKMIFETLQYRFDRDTYSPRYPDVNSQAWFAQYVFKADELGVVKGYPDGFFRPEQTVNLVEALKMAMYFTDLEILDGTVYSFADVSNDDWFSRYVQTAYREGILDGVEPGQRVYPSQAISRGQAALIIVRTLLFPVNRINPANKDILRRPDDFQDFASFQY